MFSIHPKCFTPTLGEDTKRSLLEINAPSSCKCLSLKFFNLQERGMWLCKKKSIEKNGQVSEISKTMSTQMPAMKKSRRKKKEMKKTAHAL
jgi:hypothetical protein